MTSHHATAAQLLPTATADQEALLDPTYLPETITGWHAMVGLTIGTLRGLSPGTDVEVHVEAVLEQVGDLAVADRVAWILSGRTGRQHVVLAATTGYLVSLVSPELDWSAAMRLEPAVHAPRVVSVASAEGVLPVLLPIAG